MMKLSLNIKTRLALWYLLIIAVILTFFSFITYIVLSQSLYDIARGEFRLTIIQSENFPTVTEQIELLTNPRPIISYLISPEWLEQLKLKPSAPLSMGTPLGPINIDQKDFITPDMQGEQQVQLFLRSSASAPGVYEILAITQPVSEVDKTLAAFTRALFYVIPITAVLAAGFGFLLIRRMLEPVDEITRIAQDIKQRDLSQRIQVQNQDELGRLATTLNETFESLEQAFKRERRFTSDASHELRTPLSIMQSEASLALKKERGAEEYRKSLISISQEISHMSSIVNKLLFLSRIEGGNETINFESIDLSEQLTDLASNIEALCEEKSLRLNTHLAGQVRVKGDSVKLRELFLNLLDNAIKFTPPGGTITLSLVKNKEQAVISVSDSGIGIGEEHISHIFERFYRIDKTSSSYSTGSGLGLAICKHIVEIHHGQILVESAVGKGSRFTVKLPFEEN